MEPDETFLTCFITGTGQGLGRALAVAALKAGHRVVATTRRDPERLRDELLAELGEGTPGLGEDGAPAGDPAGRLLVRVLDVTDRDDCRGAVHAAVEHFGGVDVLVNNAGYGLVGAIEEVSEQEARQMVDTGVFGALWLTQAVLPGMRAKGAGRIVQVSSTGGVGTMPTMGLYGVAKWGLEAFSEALAAEVAALGIRVSIVEPGALDTAWATGSMRFSAPDPTYDGLRADLFGTAEVPWPVAPGSTGGGTPPAEAARTILEHVAAPDDERLRVLVGDDAPGQVAAVLAARRRDYARDPRFHDEGAEGRAQR